MEKPNAVQNKESSHATICSSLVMQKTQKGSNPAILRKVSESTKGMHAWQPLNWEEYFDQIEQMAQILSQSCHVEKGQTVAILSNTRFEWSLLDWALLSLGAVVVPIYQTVTLQDLEMILNHSESNLLIVENLSLYKNFLTIKDRCPLVRAVISIETINSDLLGDQMPPVSLPKLKENYFKDPQFHLQDFIEKLRLDDLATLVYTSGTTGDPKGVMLSHQQLLSEIEDVFQALDVTPKDVTLSFLPYSHILGRIEHWAHAYIGFTLAHAESFDRLKKNLADVAPTLLISVPRVFEKIYSQIQTQMDSQSWIKRVFSWGLNYSIEVNQKKQNQMPLTLLEWGSAELIQKYLFTQIRQVFGGRLRFAFCGGAPMNPEISQFFFASGILILEGYGLTETTAAISVNPAFDFRFGTVGKPVGDVKIKLAEDGEILVHSQKVMKGYFKDASGTANAFVDGDLKGYFKTGDIGELLPSGHLKITDRKKDLIKTSGGKYVAPQKIEAVLKENALISQVLVHGDQEKFIVCLFTLNQEMTLKIAREKNLNYVDYASLTQDQTILNMVRDLVADANSKLASFESIKRFSILPQDFSVEAGELTPSLKIKRKFLDKKLHAEIKALYR